LRKINNDDDINNQIKDSRGRSRYYRNPLKNNNYLLYNQWVEGRHRKPLIEMLTELNLL
jgi:hypothetical protein